MRVTLIEYTGKGSANERWRAAHVMIFTKNTRVQMSPSLLREIETEWPEEKVIKELEYMANTIPSSWEFCDYTFMIEGVTRALTHQLVRARHASFAQQTMQVLDVRGWQHDNRCKDQKNRALYEECMREIADAYDALLEGGETVEAARGVLPTNILTNIVMKVNLRTLCELIHKRESPRNLGEISQLMLLLKDEVLVAHPWSGLFFSRTFDVASRDLDDKIMALDVPREERMAMCKLVDQMRQRA